MTRPRRIRWLVIASVAMWIFGASSVAPAAKGVAVLQQAVQVLGNLGDSMTRLAQSFRGDDVGDFDAAVAERTYERLRSLSASLSQLVGSQRGSLFAAIESFLEEPDKKKWQGVQRHLEEVLFQVKKILLDVEAERSDFVLETTYGDLIETLRTRASVTERLIRLPRPKTPEELALVRELQAKYVVLVENLEQATQALNAYLKDSKAEPQPSSEDS